MSIIDTIKKMLGLSPDYSAFDTDILFFINSAIMDLSQLGVCSPNFQITENGKENLQNTEKTQKSFTQRTE